MGNTPKYSFLHLVMRRQYRSAQITHFGRFPYGTAEGRSLQSCIVIYEKGTPLEIISWKFSVSFKAFLTNFVKSSFSVAL